LSEAKHEEENMPSVHTSTYGLFQCTKDGEKKRERERERERKRESERGGGDEGEGKSEAEGSCSA